MEISKNIALKLKSMIVHPQELAARRAKDDYNYYVAIDMRALENEAIAGGMPREEFRKILVDDLRERYAKYEPKRSKFSIAMFVSDFFKWNKKGELCKQ